jgi:hypothetical protein
MPELIQSAASLNLVAVVLWVMWVEVRRLLRQEAGR